MKNAFIAAATLTAALIAQTSYANEEINPTDMLKVKMTTGETSLQWKLEYTGCSKDKHLVTMVSDGSLMIADPTTLVPEKVKKIADIYNRTMATAEGEWLSVDLSTAKEIETGQENIPRVEAIDRSQKSFVAQVKFTNDVRDELGIDIIGSNVHFKVAKISPTPSPACK